jgi:hypothetical protein
MTAHVRLPPKRILRHALEVGQKKGVHVRVSPEGAVELLTPFGIVLDQSAINAVAREIEIAEEQGGGFGAN